jgi:hypothetical protein
MTETSRPTARAPLAPGDVIHGFAFGAFGRDHYHCVRIEAVGPDWVVARDPDLEDHPDPSFAAGAEELQLLQQARDEGHKTEYGEVPEPCPLEHLPLTVAVQRGGVVVESPARRADQIATNVADLYERWLKAGPPPLGASVARWYDARLVELRNALLHDPTPTDARSAEWPCPRP